MDKGIVKKKDNILALTGKKTSLLVFVFFYSLFLLIFTDYLAYEKTGAIISILFTLLVLAVSIFSFKYSLLLGLFLLFTFPTYPRDILDIYSLLQEAKVVKFYSIKYMSVAGFTLGQWLFLGLFLVSFIRFILSGGVIGSANASRLLRTMYSLAMVLMVGTLYSIFLGEELYLREFVSDLRFPILFVFGIFIAWAYVEDVKDIPHAINLLLATLVLIWIVSSLKSCLFIVDDKINGIFRLSLANPVFLTFPLLLTFIFIHNRVSVSKFTYYLMVFIGAISIFPEGRGIVVIYFAVVIVSFFVIWNTERNKLPSFIFSVLFIFLCAILIMGAVVLTNERLRGFILGKAAFFTEELFEGEFSKSPSVRIYEFKNIISENIDTKLGLIFGKGAGGYFTDRNYEFPFSLDVSDYTPRELSLHKYFHPHLPINFWLLKGGIVGLILYTYVFFKMFRVGSALLSYKKSIPYVMFSFFVILSSLIAFFQSYWQPDYIFFYAFILTLSMLSLEEVKKKRIHKGITA